MNRGERGRSGIRGYRSAFILSAVLTALGAPAPIWAADSSQTATKPPPSSPPIFSWSGFHFGATLGGAAPVSRSETLQAVSGIVGPGYDLNPPSNERAGITFGATLGYNFQNGPIVYGAETELNFLDGRRAPAGTFLAPPAYAAMGVGSYTLTPDEGGNYFASLRGRVGFAYGRALPYLTAGVASGGWRGASTLTLNGGVPGNPFTSGLTASSRMKYVVGAGVDYALFDNWSARAEYLFLDQSLGTQVFDNGNMYDFLSKARTESHIFRLGLIYNLGAATILRSPETKEKDKSADDKKPARAWTLWPNVAEQGVGNKTSTASQSEKINPATPEDTAEVERYSFHGQITVLPQGYPKLNALYTGTNSLPPDGQVRATVSNTAFFGLRLWDGGEAYLNPEIDQGYGLQGTLGVAGFTSAEAYKAGHARPYMRFQRYFIRQTIGLGGESETIDPGEKYARRRGGRQPPDVHGRQIFPARHFRRQPICARRPQRFHELVGHRNGRLRLRGQLMGLHQWRDRGMEAGPVDGPRRLFPVVADAERRIHRTHDLPAVGRDRRVRGAPRSSLRPTGEGEISRLRQHRLHGEI